MDSQEACQLLSQRVTQARYNDLPILLLKCADIIKLADGPRNLVNCGLGIKLYEVVCWDYLKVQGAWKTAAQITSVACDLCFTTRYQPDTLTKHVTQLLQTLLTKYSFAASEQNKKEHKQIYESVLVTLANLLQGLDVLNVKQWLWSPELTQLVDSASDSPTKLPLLKLMADRHKWQRSLVELNESANLTVIQPHADFLQKSLQSGTSDNLELITLSSVIVTYLVRAMPLVLSRLRKRYPTLDTSLSKQAAKQSTYNAALGDLRRLLDPQSKDSINLTAKHEASARLQAHWRGRKARGQMQKMTRGFIKLQRAYRLHRFKKQVEAKKTAQLTSKHFESIKQSIRKSRDYHERRLATIATVHPKNLEHMLQSEADHYATIIQTAYRGHLARRRHKTRQIERKEFDAAVTIQRSIQKYAEEQQRQRGTFAWPPIDNAMREKLQQKIDKITATRDVLERYDNYDAQNELFINTQTKLSEHLRAMEHDVKMYNRREALMARIDMDLALVESWWTQILFRFFYAVCKSLMLFQAAPSLSDVSAEQAAQYHTGRQYIQLAAERMHNEQMNRIMLPKWKLMLHELSAFHIVPPETKKHVTECGKKYLGIHK